ncbi:hypothetical protein [Nocardioides nitrophenolicus]|uniref:hypothetical protein n=1 Tax=Nocardioides nitrophenolicus TaxID=60489 RepID=UPI00195DAD64|nr:hypothetical protein [Nocardioides nitrophenolicus]MBM7519989.1 hypothetical protein [Nocardioides nitrophenolicus]
MTTQQPALTITLLRALWRVLREIAHGVDAGALVAHGRPVPADHPARRRLDHEEVERRLAELYPRLSRRAGPASPGATPRSRPPG